MKKVIILSASPRKGGNSDLLCDQFMLGAKEEGHEVEKIFVCDMNIKYCIGCMACMHNGGRCVQKDDMEDIMKKMIAADIIVMATPIYFYTMNAQMKTLIDRCCPLYMTMKDKTFYFIMSAADKEKNTTKYTMNTFQGFLDCLDNPKIAGTISGLGATDVGDIKDHPAMQEAYEMGKNI